jgi:cystathionine gamma-synthase
LQTYGPPCTFFGFGTAEDIDKLELRLQERAENGNMVQVLWCECASNPLLRTPDLDKIRRLTDKYGFVVVVDETMGSSANVDVLGVADITVSSLSKTFIGYGDALCGRYVDVASPTFHYRLLCTHQKS